MEAFDRYVGQVFDRRYKIVKIIGVGGMAVVFEAIDTVMRRTVAVKMLKDEIANDAPSVKRFINESKAVSMLSHPNIVSIYDVSVKENLKYIVMERVEGITLKNYMNKRGALPLKEIVSYTEQILRALEHAHSKGIIHRDIKPQNIMLLKNGRIKVTDFGIAKLPNAETVTMTDKAIGTVYYISPEQASGRQIDPRSDLYSLGVVMYEMATGTLPFHADSPVSVALMQVNNQPKPPREIVPTIPLGLEQIILAAMEKNPERRFQSAGQMLRHLTQIRSDPGFIFKSKKETAPPPGGSARRETQGSKPKKRKNRSMLPIISGVTAAFLIVIGISAAYVLTRLFDPDTVDSSMTIEIPSLVGSMYSAVLEQELKEKNYYNLNIEFVYDETSEEDTIIEQDPNPGEKRKVQAGTQYTDLYLKVSKGIQTIELPDFTVLEYRVVEQKLRNLGLKPKTVPEYNETMLNGYVFKTDPVPGTVVAVGDTVTIYYSKGQEIISVSVPDFVGMTEQQAMATLIQHNLGLGKVTYEHSSSPRGTVLSQSKTPYSEVAEKSTKIDFVVSLGPEETEESFDIEPPPDTGFSPPDIDPTAR